MSTSVSETSYISATQVNPSLYVCFQTHGHTRFPSITEMRSLTQQPFVAEFFGLRFVVKLSKCSQLWKGWTSSFGELS